MGKGRYALFDRLQPNCLISKPQDNGKLFCAMHCAMWYYSYNFKNVKNTHGRVLLLVMFQAKVCNFTKCNISPWVVFTFFKLQMLPNRAKSFILS